MEPKGDLLAGVEFGRVRLILRYCNLSSRGISLS